MAKKPQESSENGEQQRLSRKEILIQRKHERQLRNIRIAIAVILTLIAIVVAVALINELVITPNRTVATVGDRNITIREWQDRVRFDRAQRIIFLENQLEAFGGDVGIVQQFGGQVITDLMEPETLGQSAIDQMAADIAACTALEERGVTITEAEIDAEIGRVFNYFDGASPTSLPEPTQTTIPTPSLTPIPTAVITEVVPTATAFPTPTEGPTSTPFPTPTPVSREAFDEEFGGLLTQFTDLGISEATYRDSVRNQLCRSKLTDILAEEQAIATVAPHASIFVISAETEEAANGVLAQVESDGFLASWNTIRSQPEPAEAEESPPAFAYELLWRTRENLETSIGEEVAAQAFELDLNEPSGIIAVQNDDGTTTYYVVMVSGREERELQPGELESRKQQALQLFLDEQLAANLTISEAWRTRIPSSPVLDPKFLAAPTAAPTDPALPTVPVEVEPTAESGE